MKTAKAQTLWESFRRFEGVNSDAYAVTSFRTPPAVADDLLLSMMAGAKRATAGPMHYFGDDREEPLPIPGGYTVLLDRHDRPRLIWRTTKLAIGPLSSVTAAHAWTDGEGGGERDAWLAVIRKSFTEQARRNRFEMHDGIETMFEAFEVVWPRATAARIKRLDAHHRRGLQLLQQLDEDHVVAWNVEAVMAHIETAILTIDRTMRLHYANPTAQALLRREDGVRFKRGLVAPRYPEDERALSAILASRAGGMAQGIRSTIDNRVSYLEIRRDASVRPYRASVFPLSSLHATGPLSPAAEFVLFVEDPDHADMDDQGEGEFFSRIFHLTPAEAKLASNLTGGTSLTEAADALHITRNTARAHLRAIFDKTGARRQADLVRTLLTARMLKLSMR